MRATHLRRDTWGEIRKVIESELDHAHVSASASFAFEGFWQVNNFARQTGLM